MKTAISVPDADFERIERAAARLGMNRSQFFRVAALNYADLVEGGSSLTAAANAALTEAGQPLEDGLFAAEVRRIHRDGSAW